MTLIPKFKAKLKKATSIVGFLNHLQGDLKVKAVEAGCDTVMPRSAFSQSLPNLLRRYGIEEEEEYAQQPMYVSRDQRQNRRAHSHRVRPSLCSLFDKHRGALVLFSALIAALSRAFLVPGPSVPDPCLYPGGHSAPVPPANADADDPPSARHPRPYSQRSGNRSLSPFCRAISAAAHSRCPSSAFLSSPASATDPICSRGTTSTCTGAFGLMSAKA